MPRTSRHIRILPSGHEFVAEPHESVLEAALRAGLNLNYRCNNGTCGKCKARVVDGVLEPIQHHDYVLSEAEKTARYAILCCYGAQTDLVIEADEAASAEDIPAQQVVAKVRKLEHPHADMAVMHVRTPRSNTLRFLAGQHASLSMAGHVSEAVPIASCPCDHMNLQFHFGHAPDDPFSRHVFHNVRSGDEVLVEGPAGSFTLDEDSTRPLLFIAVDLGFAPIKSLIEHALSLEKTQPMHLFRFSSAGSTHYLDNFCRSLADAIDNFHYHPRAFVVGAGGSALQAALIEYPHIDGCDIYASGDAEFLIQLCDHIAAMPSASARLRAEPVDGTGNVVVSDACLAKG